MPTRPVARFLLSQAAENPPLGSFLLERSQAPPFLNPLICPAPFLSFARSPELSRLSCTQSGGRFPLCVAPDFFSFHPDFFRTCFFSLLFLPIGGRFIPFPRYRPESFFPNGRSFFSLRFSQFLCALFPPTFLQALLIVFSSFPREQLSLRERSRGDIPPSFPD